jgi:hypothetical protein
LRKKNEEIKIERSIKETEDEKKRQRYKKVDRRVKENKEEKAK